jgi:hypothetical protein
MAVRLRQLMLKVDDVSQNHFVPPKARLAIAVQIVARSVELR